MLPKERFAIQRIEQMLSLTKQPYLALSFGKDSLVLWDMIRKIEPNIKCIFLTDTETFHMYEYAELIQHYQDNYSINLEVIYTNTLLNNEFDIEKTRKERKKNWFLPQFIEKDGVFMGLRIEENNVRRLTLLNKKHNEIGRFLMQYKSGRRTGQYRSCPIADWTADEVMTYTKMNNIKLLKIYSYGSFIRTSARIPRDTNRANALSWIRISDPKKYQELKKLIPELRLL